MLVKFEQNRMVQNTQNFEFFDKKKKKKKKPNQKKQNKTKQNKTKNKQTNKQKNSFLKNHFWQQVDAFLVDVNVVEIIV